MGKEELEEKSKEELLEELREAKLQIAELQDREKASHQAEEARARLAAIVESSDDAIIGKTLEGIITNWNTGAKKIFGYSEEEVIGHPVSILIPPDYPNEEPEMLEKLKRGERIEHYETKRMRKNGQLIDISLSISPIGDASGKIIGVSKIARDMTERRLAAERVRSSEAQYRLLFENNPQCMWIFDPETLAFLAVNNTAIHSYGYSSEEFLQMTLKEIYPPEDMPKLREIVAKRTTENSTSDTVRHCKKDGSIIYVEVVSNSITFEGKLARFMLAHDITGRKIAEEALLKERALLAQRIEERTADLSLANAELARASRLKDDFLASMSHELRTPLNAILGLSEALEEGVYGHLNKEQAETLNFIKESGAHLLSLINDILDLSKIEAGRFELVTDQIVVEPICQASLAFIKQATQKKHLKVSITFDNCITAIEADERRLKQILVNLLTNAVKFTPEYGSIGLEVKGDIEHQTAQFIVWDTGMGISKEDLPRLFQPFVQLDSNLNRQQTGTGLGLALVYRMVEMQGGSISVESEKGKGSRFIISLPWLTKDVKGTIGSFGEEKIVNFDKASLQVLQLALIIEDSPTSAAQMVRYLEELDIKAVVHPSNNGVLDAILKIKPDVIFLDILLPEPTGWKVLAQLKSDPRFQHIPVIIISVIDEKGHGLELGAAEYLVKPITRQQMQIALAKVVSLSQKVPDLDSLPISVSLPQEKAAAQKLILLAEDNNTNIKLLNDYLLMKGYRIVIARNGREAIEQAKETSPDLILMDIQMPIMDGLEAIRWLKADAKLAKIPIIALTALVMSGDRERCLEAGVDYYLSKPANLKALSKIIEELFSQPGRN